MKASDNEFPSVLLDEQVSAPTTPGTGLWRVYAKSDGLYTVDDAGTEAAVGEPASLPYTAVFHSTTQSITPLTPWVSLLFDSEDNDDDGWHDTGSNTSRVTVDADGLYGFTGVGSLSSGSTGAVSAMVRLFLNGTTEIIRSGLHNAFTGVGFGNMYPQVSAYRRLSANDYVELQMFQNNDGAPDSLSTVANNSRLHVVRLGP